MPSHTGGHMIERVVVPRPLDLRRMRDAPAYVDAPQYIEVIRSEYLSPALGWRGAVLCERGDQGRLLDVLWFAEGVLLLLAWICGKARWT